jgi:hypothetical protein
MFLIVPKLILMVWFGHYLDLFEMSKYDKQTEKGSE